MSLNSFYNEKCFRQKLYRKNTFYVQLLFSENHAIYDTMSKEVVESERLWLTTQYGAYALHAG